MSKAPAEMQRAPGVHTEYMRPRCAPIRIWNMRCAINSCRVSISRLASNMAWASWL